MISLKGMHPKGGANVEGGDATRETATTPLTEADQLLRDAFLKGMNPEDGRNVKYREYQAIEQQARDTVAWILDTNTELLDDQRMLQKLSKLEGSIEAAMKIYGEQFGQNYGNIQTMMMNMEYIPELKAEIIELQTLFAGLQNKALSGNDIIVFRDYMEDFMKKSPETQARMLWYFELVNDYVISKSSNLSLHTNPLKNLLFKETNISYEDWILRIFANFERDEAGMTALIEAIRNAEAPQVGSKKFIRHLYETRPEVIDEEDLAWLYSLYTQWPDETVTDSPGTISAADKKKRNSIAEKYMLEYAEKGKTTPKAVRIAQEFRDMV